MTTAAQPFIFAVGLPADAPYIPAPRVDGWDAWRVFLTYVQQGWSVTCRYGHHQRAWHPVKGFQS